MVPTALLRRSGLLLGQGRPDAQVAIGDGTAPRLQPAGAQIPEYRAPWCFRLPLAALHCQHHLPAVCEGTDHDQERRVGVFESRFDIQAIGPHVHDLQVLQPALFPRLILKLPPGLELGQRRRG
jgi:hypothetical protein